MLKRLLLTSNEITAGERISLLPIMMRSGYFLNNLSSGYINVVTDCSSLGMENIKIEKVLVFPNPAKDVLYLQSPKEVQKIEIFDMSGRKILQKNVNKKEDQINIEILKSGIYILKTFTDNSSQTFKIIKKD